MCDIFPTYIKTLNFNLEHIYSRIREKRILVSLARSDFGSEVLAPETSSKGMKRVHSHKERHAAASHVGDI